MAPGTKAFGYLRVSGRSQGDEGRDGLPRQLAAVNAYARANGLEVEAVFTERGVPGATEALARPAWGAMLEAILANGVRTILVERLDRIARDLLVQEHIIADLRKRGIILVSVAEPDLCIDDPSRKLMRQIWGGIAEYDKTMLVAKLAAARARIRARGERCDGRIPYGLHPQHPHEAAILADMRRQRAAGLSPAAIARSLNESGVKTRSGGLWWPGVLSRMLLRVA